MIGIRALTCRGRAFLASAVAVAAGAFILGEEDLLRISLLAAALPLLSGLAAARARYRLSCARLVNPVRLAVGEQAAVTLRVRNAAILRTPVLLAEETVPPALGAPQRFVLTPIEPHGIRDVRYRISAQMRGRYRIGPLTIRVADPLGLVTRVSTYGTTDVLVVTPKVVTLPHTGLTGEWRGSGDGVGRAAAASGEDDAAPREYRHGDDLRRVHWRSTARQGRLMVRREEQHWQNRGALLLDLRRVGHLGDGADSSVEAAISVAASIAVRLATEGLLLRFITDSGEWALAEAGFRGALLEGLAIARPSPNRSLAAGLRALRRGGEEGLIVAVLGRLGLAEAAALAAVRRGAAVGVAVLLDVASWAPGSADAGGPGAVGGLLARAGWRVVHLDAATPLTAVWSTAYPGDVGGAACG